MSYGKDNNTSYFVLKLDLSKTFDKAEWNYLETEMVAMRSPLSLVALIMNYVHSV